MLVTKLLILLRFFNFLKLIRPLLLLQFNEFFPGVITSDVRLESDHVRLELLEPALLLVHPPDGLYMQRGFGSRADHLGESLRGDHPPEGLYLYDRILQSQEFSPLQAGAEPLLYRSDARYDLLMQLNVQLDLLGLSEEDFRGAQLIIVPIEIESQQEVSHVGLRAQKTLGKQHSIQLYKFLVCQSHIETSLSYSDCLQHPRVAQLPLHRLLIEFIRHFISVALDTPDEKRIGLVQSVHQTVQALLELRGYSHGLLPGLSGPGTVTLSSPGERLHSLQIFQTLFAAFSRPERFVFPAKVSVLKYAIISRSHGAHVPSPVVVFLYVIVTSIRDISYNRFYIHINEHAIAYVHEMHFAHRRRSYALVTFYYR